LEQPKQACAQADLFKTIRKEVQNKQSAFDLIRNLDTHAHVYSALRDPQSDHWSQDQRDSLLQLKLFAVRQPMSLLMAAHEAYADKGEDGFNRLLRAVSVISFRYNVVCNMQSNEQERVYNEVAVRISREKIGSKQALAELARVYPNESNSKPPSLTRNSARQVAVTKASCGIFCSASNDTWAIPTMIRPATVITSSTSCLRIRTSHGKTTMSIGREVHLPFGKHDPHGCQGESRGREQVIRAQAGGVRQEPFRNYSTCR
jgi:hypothetical protein